MPEASALTLLPLHRSGNVQMIDYAMLRKPAHSLMLFLFGALFGGIGILLWSIAAQEGFMLYVMSLIFNLVGWGIAAAGIYAAFNALQVRLDGRQLSSTRSLFGFKISDQRVAYTEIRNIQVSKGMQSQSGHRHHIEYRVFALTDEAKIALAENLHSASAARLVEEHFRQEFGLTARQQEYDENAVKLDLS
jgi:hypothetical protein